MRAGVQCAKHVIGHINGRMPRTMGESLIHISQFDRVFRCVALPEWIGIVHPSFGVDTPRQSFLSYKDDRHTNARTHTNNNRKDVEIPESAAGEPTAAEAAIGKLIAENLVVDG